MFKKESLPTFKNLEIPHEILPLTGNWEPHAQMTALLSASRPPWGLRCYLTLPLLTSRARVLVLVTCWEHGHTEASGA